MKIDTKGKDYFEDGKVYHADEDGFVNTPGTDTTANPIITKDFLIAKALELELGTQDEISAMTAEELTTLIADNTDEAVGDDKAALVAKALALKESNPKALRASPSAIPAMSVAKLTTLIAEAEVLIAEKA